MKEKAQNFLVPGAGLYRQHHEPYIFLASEDWTERSAFGRKKNKQKEIWAMFNKGLSVWFDPVTRITIIEISKTNKALTFCTFKANI